MLEFHIDMFERLLEQCLAVYAVYPAITRIEDALLLDLSDDHLKVIEGLTPVLKPLYIATCTMYSEEYPTVGGLYPILFSLFWLHLKADDEDTPAVSKFKADKLADLVSRHRLDNDEITSSLPVICTFLDQRYRSLPCLTDQQRQFVYAHVLERLGGVGDKDVGPSTFTEPAKPAKGQDDMPFSLGGYFEECEIITPSNA